MEPIESGAAPRAWLASSHDGGGFVELGPVGMPALDCYEEDWHHTGVHPLTERIPTEGASTKGVPAWRADRRSFAKWVTGLPLPWRKYYSHEGRRVCVAETTVKSIDPNPNPDPSH